MAPKVPPSKQKASLVVIDTDSDDETTTPTMPDGEDYESWLDELRSVRPYTSSYTPRTIAKSSGQDDTPDPTPTTPGSLPQKLEECHTMKRKSSIAELDPEILNGATKKLKRKELDLQEWHDEPIGIPESDMRKHEKNTRDCHQIVWSMCLTSGTFVDVCEAVDRVHASLTTSKRMYIGIARDPNYRWRLMGHRSHMSRGWQFMYILCACPSELAQWLERKLIAYCSGHGYILDNKSPGGELGGTAFEDAFVYLCVAP